MNPATITCLPSRTDHGPGGSCWKNLKWLGTAGLFLGAMALPLAVAEPLPGALRTIHDYRTGLPLQQAVADGTVYEFRATVPHVNFWKTPAPLDGLWIECANRQTLLWLSSTSGTVATDTEPCPTTTGGGGGSGTNCPPANLICNSGTYFFPDVCCGGTTITPPTGCCNNTPLVAGQVCCGGTTPTAAANCCNGTVLGAGQVCCGGTPRVVGTGCCVNNVWETTGFPYNISWTSDPPLSGGNIYANSQLITDGKDTLCAFLILDCFSTNPKTYVTASAILDYDTEHWDVCINGTIQHMNETYIAHSITGVVTVDGDPNVPGTHSVSATWTDVQVHPGDLDAPVTKTATITTKDRVKGFYNCKASAENTAGDLNIAIYGAEIYALGHCNGCTASEVSDWAECELAWSYKAEMKAICCCLTQWDCDGYHDVTCPPFPPNPCPYPWNVSEFTGEDWTEIESLLSDLLGVFNP